MQDEVSPRGRVQWRVGTPILALAMMSTCLCCSSGIASSSSSAAAGAKHSRRQMLLLKKVSRERSSCSAAQQSSAALHSPGVLQCRHSPFLAGLQAHRMASIDIVSAPCLYFTTTLGWAHFCLCSCRKSCAAALCLSIECCHHPVAFVVC